MPVRKPPAAMTGTVVTAPMTTQAHPVRTQAPAAVGSTGNRRTSGSAAGVASTDPTPYADMPMAR